jgi:recombinational DNA repair protein RecR
MEEGRSFKDLQKIDKEELLTTYFILTSHLLSLTRIALCPLSCPEIEKRIKSGGNPPHLILFRILN